MADLQVQVSARTPTGKKKPTSHTGAVTRTVWGEDGPLGLSGVDQASGANTFDVVGLSADGKTLQIVEAKGGASQLSKTGRIVGTDAYGNPIRAAQGSTDYLNNLLRTDKNLRALFKARPDIAQGLKDGSIRIEYSVARAPGDGTATVTDLIIDRSSLDLSFLP